MPASQPPGVGMKAHSRAPSLAERFQQIRAEYDARLAAMSKVLENVKIQSEVNQTYRTMSPDEAAFSRRMLELAESAPADPVARDALIWVVNKPGSFDHGPYGDQFAARPHYSFGTTATSPMPCALAWVSAIWSPSTAMPS